MILECPIPRLVNIRLKLGGAALKPDEINTTHTDALLELCDEVQAIFDGMDNTTTLEDHQNNKNVTEMSTHGKRSREDIPEPSDGIQAIPDGTDYG